jgi:hypothetical protein
LNTSVNVFVSGASDRNISIIAMCPGVHDLDQQQWNAALELGPKCGALR